MFTNKARATKARRNFRKQHYGCDGAHVFRNGICCTYSFTLCIMHSPATWSVMYLMWKLIVYDGIWLFDCGECSQVQLMKSPLKPGKINKIFITHLHGDHLYGLPGLLCTISQNNQREEPVEIYGPLGLRHYICTSLGLARSDVCFEFVVHELQPLTLQNPDNSEEWPLEYPKLIPFHPRERPGKVITSDINEVWHLHSDKKLSVKAVWVKHRIPCFAFVVYEADRPGNVLVEAQGHEMLSSIRLFCKKLTMSWMVGLIFSLSSGEQKWDPP
ncbi:elac ribonuclease z 1 [Plakobranchus ocellatus]|uniref:Elac ribonuclease z 1 n=1 Tax=Plakobranchus ocellatus TaxID=259542 RepID=A0AAV4BNN3_9GAST|nr:elac ribonuclease z 1 [Plakobranchus ocellatus]